MPTPHLAASAGSIAPDVLLPGDPARARRIAERILHDHRIVSDVRGNPVHTGTYRGHPLSVLASGMGMASTAIYATELGREYGVRRIVRIGTAAAIAPDVAARDVVVATAAHTDAPAWAQPAGSNLHLSSSADLTLVLAAARAVEALPPSSARTHLGTIFSTDTFYGIPAETLTALRAIGTLAVEMESAALFQVAARERFASLTVLSVSSDARVSLSPDEREAAFGNALDLALAALYPDADS